MSSYSEKTSVSKKKSPYDIAVAVLVSLCGDLYRIGLSKHTVIKSAQLEKCFAETNGLVREGAAQVCLAKASVLSKVQWIVPALPPYTDTQHNYRPTKYGL